MKEQGGSAWSALHALLLAGPRDRAAPPQLTIHTAATGSRAPGRLDHRFAVERLFPRESTMNAIAERARTPVRGPPKGLAHGTGVTMGGAALLSACLRIRIGNAGALESAENS
jgi:hypothetical protein